MTGRPVIDLAGRGAIVTGAAGGIGLAIARTLAASGAHVCMADIDADAAREAACDIGGAATGIAGDVADEADVAAMVEAAHDAAGRIDILVNNAGVAQPLVPLDALEPAEWQRVFDVNLRGSFLMSRAAAGAMIAGGGGTIVNIASVAGMTGFPASHAYGVSKAAIAMMTKTLACELARREIRVNAVAPGVIEAPMIEEMSRGGAYLDTIVSRVPMGRLGLPEEVGRTVAFLCSDMASYITGAVLPVDGGWLAFGGAGAASRPDSAVQAKPR